MSVEPLTLWGFNIKEKNFDPRNYGEKLPLGLEQDSSGYISVGFDLRKIPSSSDLDRLWPKESENRRGNYRWQVEQFLGYHRGFAMRKWDYVIFPLTARPVCAVGKVTSNPKLFETPYGHHIIRNVSWLNRRYKKTNWRGTSITPRGTIMPLKQLNHYLSKARWTRTRLETMFEQNLPLEFDPIDADGVFREGQSLADLVERFSFLPPSYFEDLIEALVHAQGYSVDTLWRSGASDGGVDIIANWSKTLFDPESKTRRVYIQVKRKPIDESMISNLADNDTDEVILVTSKEIPDNETKRMIEKAHRHEFTEVRIVDGSKIAKLAAKYHRALPQHVATILNLYSGGSLTRT